MSDLTPCSLEDVRAILQHQLQLLHTQATDPADIAPLMLWGPPGVGKSSVVRDVCRHHGIGFLDIRLAQREPIDLRGLPVPKGDAVDWLLSSDWPRDPHSRGIILFDELTAADRSLQVAAYEIILDRRLGTLYDVPPGWLIVGAGNRITDRAVAGAMSSALANRFCHLELEPSLAEWLQWAQQSNLDPRVSGFLQFRPSLFFDMTQGDLQRGWPSPRSWTRVAISLAHAGHLDRSRLQRILDGLVGPGPGAELRAFLDLVDSLPNVAATLAGTQRFEVPERADTIYALCTAVVAHFWRVPQRERAIERLFDLLEDLTADFATMLLADVVRGQAARDTRAIYTHPRFLILRQQLGPLLRGRLMGTAAQRNDALLAELSA